MAALRRTKNFATDPQTPMFLYTILKQLDLRSINWNDIADALGISNGHAARMRYSRMRSQFEAQQSNLPIPPKAKKETSGETRSSKAKAKNNKRLLMEDEKARVSGQRAAIPNAMQSDLEAKRIKLEPQAHMHSWNPTAMYTGHNELSHATGHRSHPTIKYESAPLGNQSPPPQSPSSDLPVKQEPETTANSSTTNNRLATVPAVKQGRNISNQDSEMLDTSPTVIKPEPGTTLSTEMGPMMNYNYPLSRTVNAYFDRHQSQMTLPLNAATMHCMPSYPSLYTFANNTYPQSYGRDSNQSSSSWAITGSPYGTATEPSEKSRDHMMLNPYAVTYQDMLNMPLYSRSPSILHVPQGIHEQPTGQVSMEERPHAPQQQMETDTALTKHLATDVSKAAAKDTSSARTETSVAPAGADLQHNPKEESSAMLSVIEVESDVDEETRSVSPPVAGAAAVAQIKREIVEL